MKRYLILVLLVLSCTEKAPDPIIEDWSFSGEWLAAKGGAGGINAPESFKNFQLEYVVEEDNKEISYQLGSDALDVAFALYNTRGELVHVSDKGRNVTHQVVLNAGTYRMVVMADRNGVGNFRLNVHGIRREILPIPFNLISSGNKNWGELGGGGPYITPKNHIYSFEVTEDNTFVDIELVSNNTDVGLYITNANGEIIQQGTGRRNLYGVIKFNKGVYYIMAATHTRGARGDYALNLYGRVKGLKQSVVQSKVIEGAWANVNDWKTYEVEVTEDNSVLDVELTSPADYWISFEVVDSKGVRLITPLQLQAHKNWVAATLPVQRGKYTINYGPGPYVNTAPKANFKLAVVGSLK